MREYEARRIMSIQYLRSFPRSAALISAAIVAAVSLDPLNALTVGVVTWLFLTILNAAIRIIMPNFVDLGMWMVCSYLVVPVGSWVIKWPATVIGAVIALARGSPSAETLYVLGGILFFDVVMTLIFRT